MALSRCAIAHRGADWYFFGPSGSGSAGRSGESPGSGDDLSPSRRPPLVVVRSARVPGADPVALFEGRGEVER